MACPCPVRTKSRACAVSWSGPASSSSPLSLLLLPLLVVPCACRGAAGSGAGRCRSSASLGVRFAVASGSLSCLASLSFVRLSLPPVRSPFLPFFACLSLSFVCLPAPSSSFLPLSCPSFPLARSFGLLLGVGRVGGRSVGVSALFALLFVLLELVPSAFTEHGGLLTHHAPGLLDGMVAFYHLTMFQYLSGVCGRMVAALLFHYDPVCIWIEWFFHRPHCHRVSRCGDCMLHHQLVLI